MATKLVLCNTANKTYSNRLFSYLDKVNKISKMNKTSIFKLYILLLLVTIGVSL